MVLMEKDLILFEPCPFDELILKFLLCKIAPHYVEEFFLSYQNVASPGFLLEKLTNIYYSNAIHIPLDWMNKNLLDKTLEDHKIKVIRFINLWLEYGSFEIGEERKVFKRINLFITDATSNISKENFLFDYLTDCGNKIKLKILQKLHNEPDWALKIQGRSRLTDRSESYDVSNSFMSDFKEEDIVQQLAIISYDVMVRITPSEFLKVRWSKSNKLSTAPNIVNCINRFNIMSGWYAHMILKQQVPEKRAQLIMLLIRLAELCEKLKNYNSLMELLSGLHFGCISRLKRTWRLIPQKTLDLFNQLSKMMTPLRNYQYYRKLMNNIQKDDPYVPFLGVFLADFTFMEEANPDHDEEGNVNMEKICMMGNHIRTFRRFSQRPYPFNPNHLLQQSLFIQRQPLDEAELYRISTLLEKPDQTLDNSKYQQIDEKSITTQQRMSLGRVFQQNYSLMTSQRFTSVLNYEGATDDNISFRDWQVLLTCSRLVTCRKGQVIFPQGRINDAIYYIHAGRVDLEYSSPSGEKQHLATLASTDVLCDVLGMMSDHMFMAQPWVEINSREGFSDFRFGHNSESGAESAVSAIAGSHGTQLMEIQADFLYRIFLSEPELAEKFFKQCVRYLAHLVRNQNDQRKHKNLRSVLGPETDEKEDTENSYDSTFRKDFSIKECREVVIKEYRCTRQPKNLKSKLYISQNYLCLSSRVFKIRKKLVIPLKDLHVVNASDSDLTFSSTTKKKDITVKFNSDMDAEEARSLLGNLKDLLQANDSTKAISQKKRDPTVTPELRRRKSSKVSSHLLSPKDWQLILGNSKAAQYHTGDYILRENDENQRLFLVQKGSVSIRKLIDGQETKVCRLMPHETFGEFSVVEGCPACASVVAESDDVEVHVVDGYFLRLLFDVNTGLAGRFYFFLASVFAQRLKRILERRPISSNHPGWDGD